MHIEDAIFGITMYGSNPILNNVTIFNPNRVGIDIFESSSPVIRDLHVEQAGRSVPFQNDWRYGIGLSVGDGSTPIVQGAYFTDHQLRGLNLWGASGGIYRDVVMDNISGSVLGEVAGVWVEDSVPLFEDLTIDKSDTGIIVRHIDDSETLEACFEMLISQTACFEVFTRQEQSYELHQLRNSRFHQSHRSWNWFFRCYVSWYCARCNRN